MNKIMSDGTSNGIVIFYMKGGKLYPVALDKRQIDNLNLTLGATLNEINVINAPLNTEVGNILGKKEKR